MCSFAENSGARFDYDILETFEAGLVLDGQEVKSVRRGSGSIKGSFVKILNNEAWLLGSVIPPYQPANAPKSYDSTRSRKLLLKRSELKYLIGKSHEQGLSLIPLKIFEKNGFLKLELAVARGKKKYDKRESIKKREAKRTIARAMKK